LNVRQNFPPLSLPTSLFSQLVQHRIQLFPFNVRRRSRHDVSGNAAQNVGLVSGESRRQFRDEVARDGGKGVSVVKAEGREPVAFQANVERVSQGKLGKLIFLPKRLGGLMSVGGGLVQRVFPAAKSPVDFSDKIPVEGSKPRFYEARHEIGSMGGGFSQAGLDPLQRLDAFALEITFSGARENGFGGKTILDAKRILHDSFQPFLRFRHVSKVIARPRNRKLKKLLQLNLSIALTGFRE